MKSQLFHKIRQGEYCFLQCEVRKELGTSSTIYKQAQKQNRLCQRILMWEDIRGWTFSTVGRFKIKMHYNGAVWILESDLLIKVLKHANHRYTYISMMQILTALHVTSRSLQPTTAPNPKQINIVNEDKNDKLFPCFCHKFTFYQVPPLSLPYKHGHMHRNVFSAQLLRFYQENSLAKSCMIFLTSEKIRCYSWILQFRYY